MSNAGLAVPPRRQSFRVSAPNDAITPKIAREQVALLLSLTRHASVADVAKLLVSEIVTNVHVHTSTPVVHVDVTVGPGRVYVAVWDDAPCPRLHVRDARDPRAGEERGRGLLLVQEMATRWGVTWPVEPGRARKRVWFTLDEHRTAARIEPDHAGPYRAPGT
ncbi:ATP-binding protein [Streptomyces sp. NPDC050617]|uniref:ATP-binding protein n=1 Tax=Streptomyces sp. NPDC050617 TaxID=3154628 RepID=UPI00343549BC